MAESSGFHIFAVEHGDAEAWDVELCHQFIDMATVAVRCEFLHGCNRCVGMLGTCVLECQFLDIQLYV